MLTAVKDLSDLDNDCGREPNEDCGFNCIKNYKPAINSLTIKCLPGNAQGVARWNVTTATLCEGLHLYIVIVGHSLAGTFDFRSHAHCRATIAQMTLHKCTGSPEHCGSHAQNMDVDEDCD